MVHLISAPKEKKGHREIIVHVVNRRDVAPFHPSILSELPFPPQPAETSSTHVCQKANLTNPFSRKAPRASPGQMVRIMKGSSRSPSTRECALEINGFPLGQGYVEDVDNKWRRERRRLRFQPILVW